MNLEISTEDKTDILDSGIDVRKVSCQGRRCTRHESGEENPVLYQDAGPGYNSPGGTSFMYNIPSSFSGTNLMSTVNMLQ